MIIGIIANGAMLMLPRQHLLDCKWLVDRCWASVTMRARIRCATTASASWGMPFALFDRIVGRAREVQLVQLDGVSSPVRECVVAIHLPIPAEVGTHNSVCEIHCELV